jgi:hypothetical protein
VAGDLDFLDIDDFKDYMDLPDDVELTLSEPRIGVYELSLVDDDYNPIIKTAASYSTSKTSANFSTTSVSYLYVDRDATLSWKRYSETENEGLYSMTFTINAGKLNLTEGWNVINVSISGSASMTSEKATLSIAGGDSGNCKWTTGFDLSDLF